MIPQAYFDKVCAYFKENRAKTFLWFNTANPNLGGITPLGMIKMGRVKKLMAWIDHALDENKRWEP